MSICLRTRLLFCIKLFASLFFDLFSFSYNFLSHFSVFFFFFFIVSLLSSFSFSVSLSLCLSSSLCLSHSHTHTQTIPICLTTRLLFYIYLFASLSLSNFLSLSRFLSLITTMHAASSNLSIYLKIHVYLSTPTLSVPLTSHSSSTLSVVWEKLSAFQVRVKLFVLRIICVQLMAQANREQYDIIYFS